MKRFFSYILLTFVWLPICAQTSAVMTIDDAIAILEQTCFYEVKDQWGTYTRTRFEDTQVVGKILKKYGYKQVDVYEVYRETEYRPIWYKNTSRPIETDDIRPLKIGIPSTIGITVDRYIEIKVWSRNLYNNLQTQLEAHGFTFIDCDTWGFNYTSGKYDARLNYEAMTVRIYKQY